jgi:GT2 family glycosyltransferase
MLLRAAALETVGPLDEGMFLYFEETELCLRLVRSGWSVGVARDAHAYSAPGGGNRPAAHAYLTTRNGLYFAVAACGARGVVQVAGNLLAQAWRLVPKPFGRRFTVRAEWSAANLRLRGMGIGVWHFMRGERGPPPARLLRRTDISGTG